MDYTLFGRKFGLLPNRGGGCLLTKLFPNMPPPLHSYLKRIPSNADQKTIAWKSLKKKQAPCSI